MEISDSLPRKGQFLYKLPNCTKAIKNIMYRDDANKDG